MQKSDEIWRINMKCGYHEARSTQISVICHKCEELVIKVAKQQHHCRDSQQQVIDLDQETSTVPFSLKN